MGEKDMTEKALEAYNDVFADIVNVLLFSGAQAVSENDLAEATLRSQYKADGKLHEQERDVAKYWQSISSRCSAAKIMSLPPRQSAMCMSSFSSWQR